MRHLSHPFHLRKRCEYFNLVHIIRPYKLQCTNLQVLIGNSQLKRSTPNYVCVIHRKRMLFPSLFFQDGLDGREISKLGSFYKYFFKLRQLKWDYNRIYTIKCNFTNLNNNWRKDIVTVVSKYLILNTLI